ncbi:MAG: LysM peptidoglycan-binding domain-containing protein [Candidatus Omnitrophica bacterium]|nr:LysM peptidoglycan-binding domain-containing protein [Candidatus Omnitrophota bacterium]
MHRPGGIFRRRAICGADEGKTDEETKSVGNFRLNMVSACIISALLSNYPLPANASGPGAADAAALSPRVAILSTAVRQAAFFGQPRAPAADRTPHSYFLPLLVGGLAGILGIVASIGYLPGTRDAAWSPLPVSAAGVGKPIASTPQAARETVGKVSTVTELINLMRKISIDYTVTAEDSWESIAARFGTTDALLIELNTAAQQQIEHFIGKEIDIPQYAVNPRRKIYTVRAGDTWESIAKKNDTTPFLLKKANTQAQRAIAQFIGTAIRVPQYTVDIQVSTATTTLLATIRALNGTVLARIKEPVATGDKETPTPKGKFCIQRRVPQPQYKNIPYGAKGYAYGREALVIQTDHGFDLHPVSDGLELSGHTSHGCVRLRPEVARVFWLLIPVGATGEVFVHMPRSSALPAAGNLRAAAGPVRGMQWLDSSL